MNGELIAVLGLILQCAEHSDLVKKLASAADNALRRWEYPDEEDIVGAAAARERMRGLVSGLAAARANAVQEFNRRKKESGT